MTEFEHEWSAPPTEMPAMTLHRRAAGAELVGESILGDPIVEVAVTVSIASWNDADPVEEAVRLVRDGLEKSRGTIANWGGRFAVVLDVAGDGGEVKVERRGAKRNKT